MRFRGSRGFTLIELLIVIVIIGSLMAMLLPAINMVKEASRRASCQNNVKNVGLALFNFVSKTDGTPYPALSTKSVNTATPGSNSTANEAGYSWIVKILPQLDEGTLYDKISNGSKKFTTPAFTDTITATGVKMDQKGIKHVCTFPIKVLVCPSFSGDPYVLDSTFQNTTSNTGSSPGSSPWKAFEGVDTIDQKPYGPAISNYVATAASHIECMFKTKPTDTKTAEAPNGIMTPSGGVKNVPDGVSKTLVLIESREQRYAAWYDGTVNWCVAYWPDATTKPSRKSTNPSPWWWVDTNTTDKTATSSAVSKGPRDSSQPPYMKSSTASQVNSNLKDWDWGPSSEHNGGSMVTAGYGDGGTRMIQDDIDANVFMHLVTRNGQESDVQY